MSELGGLWKHQNNPACTESVSLHNVEVGHYTIGEEGAACFEITLSAAKFVLGERECKYICYYADVLTCQGCPPSPHPCSLSGEALRNAYNG